MLPVDGYSLACGCHPTIPFSPSSFQPLCSLSSALKPPCCLGSPCLCSGLASWTGGAGTGGGMMSRAWVLDEAVAGAGGTGGPQVSTSAGNGSSLVGALVLCGSASCDNSPVALLGKKLPMKAQEGVQVSGSPQAGQNPPPGSQLSKWAFFLVPTTGPGYLEGQRCWDGQRSLRLSVVPSVGAEE